MMDYSKISNIRFDGIDYKDHPDYCDAFIESAEYDGKEMTEEQLDELNDDHGFVHEKLWDHLH